jgi:hypothetical protein
MAIGPSGGMLKKIFDPATFKKKTKTALQSKIPSGGIKIKRPEMKPSGAKGGRHLKLITKGD